MATGRVPNVSDLGLEAAGISYSPEAGVRIDARGCTSNPSVYAIGDCAAGVPRFTHVSGEMAKLAVQNALFGDDWQLGALVEAVPRCVYTDPELACVGLSPIDAAGAGVAVEAYSSSLRHNDRALLEGQHAASSALDALAGGAAARRALRLQRARGLAAMEKEKEGAEAAEDEQHALDESMRLAFHQLLTAGFFRVDERTLMFSA